VIKELALRGVNVDMLESGSAGESSPLLQRVKESNDQWMKRCRRVEVLKLQK